MARDWVLLIGASHRGARALSRLGHEFASLMALGDDECPADAVMTARCRWEDDAAVDQAYALFTAGLGPAIAVLSFSERGQLPAARLAARQGIAGAALEPSRVALDKAATRRQLVDTSLEVTHEVGRLSEIVPRLRRDVVLGQRRIVKPNSGAGSRNVFLVDSTGALDEFVSSAPADDELWIIEPFFPGREFSVETVTVLGVHDVLAVTEKHLSSDGSFVEVGHVQPPALSPEELMRLDRWTHLVLDRLGVVSGAAHLEFRLGANSAVFLVEAHTRPGGDHIPELTEMTTGRDQYLEAARSILTPTAGRDGDSSDRTLLAGAAVWFISSDRAGVVVGLRAPDALVAGVPGLSSGELRLEVGVGEPIRRTDSSRTRLGCVLAGGDDRESAMRIARELAEAVLVEVVGVEVVGVEVVGVEVVGVEAGRSDSDACADPR